MQALLLLTLLATTPPRVEKAQSRALPVLRERFLQAKLPWPPSEVHLRVYKADGQLELWAASTPGAPLTRVHTYAVCAASGGPGPKRRRGDGQVPEGLYRVDRFNPWSAFHLSLGLDYPNAADRRREGPGADLGGDIFVHGGCATVGCVPLGDAAVEEVYLAAHAARANRVRVDVLPARPGTPAFAALDAGGDAALRALWDDLAASDARFARTRRPPPFTVDASGRYRLR